MIKIEAKNGKKVIKKTIEVEYIDCNINKNGEWIKENVSAYKLKSLWHDDNIDFLYYLDEKGDKFEIFIEKYFTLSSRNSTLYIYAFCPDLFIRKNLLERINKSNIKISPILVCFESPRKIIKIKKFLFPRYWTNYMKVTWLKNNNHLYLVNTKFTFTKNVVVCKQYINKHQDYIYNY